MKVSELIAKLRKILETEGDIPVTCWPYDGQGRDFDLATVKVLDRVESPTEPGPLKVRVKYSEMTPLGVKFIGTEPGPPNVPVDDEAEAPMRRVVALDA